MIVYWTIPVGLKIKDQMYICIDIKRHYLLKFKDTVRNLQFTKRDPTAPGSAFLMWGKSEVKIGLGLE